MLTQEAEAAAPTPASCRLHGFNASFDKSDRRDNFRQKKAWKRRNTFCISSFHNEFMTEISRQAPQSQ
jgi:hypothetical protein